VFERNRAELELRQMIPNELDTPQSIPCLNDNTFGSIPYWLNIIVLALINRLKSWLYYSHLYGLEPYSTTVTEYLYRSEEPLTNARDDANKLPEFLGKLQVDIC
jgi:hypothetical protein